MKKTLTIFILNLLLIASGTLVSKAQQVYYYDFRNSFNEFSGQGPDLNVLGTGTFVNDALTEISCLQRPVYGFTQNSGVQFDNSAANNFITGTYSVEMYFQFLNNAGFKRLLDYKNQTSDFGLYCTATELQFYDAITIPTTAFVANQYVHLVVTRDSVSDDVNLYVDGALLGTFIDSTNLGVLDGANVLNFFQDDLVFGGEARPGRIALLKIYDNVIDANTVAANFNSLETTSATLLFDANYSAACLAGNNFVFTNTSQNVGSVNYTWDFGDLNTASGINASHSYLADGNYTVTLLADDGTGCFDSVALQVQVYPQPVMSLGADDAICAGDSITLDAGAGFNTYLWSDNSANQTLTVSTTGTYIATVTDNNNCSATDSVDISVVQPPLVTLGNDTTLCFGSSITLNAPTGEASYLWSTGDTTESILVTGPGIYAVEVANTTGCIGNDTIEIFYYSQINLSLGADSAFCIGDTLILDAGAGFSNYTWNDGTNLQTFSVASTGNYFVTVVDSFGCSGTDSIDVTVNSLPVVDLGPDASLCGGTQLTLDAGAGFVNYVWNDGTQTQTLQISTGGTYSVIVTDVNGCAGIDSVGITVTPLVNLGPDQLYCDGVVATLDAGSGLSTYLWSDGTSLQTLDVTVTGTYTVTVSDAGGCINSDEIVVTFNPVPVFDLGPDITTCTSSPTILDPGAGFYAYLWDDGSTSQTFTVTTSGTYFVTVSSAPNCSAQDSIVVTVNPSPVISLGADTTLCDGTIYTLDAGSGFAGYLWSDGSFNSTLDVTSGGTYSVTVSGGNGCTAYDEVTITFDQLPAVELGPNQNICDGTATVLDAGAGFAGYLWSDGSSSQLLLVSTAGTYTVTVTNTSGCSTIDSVSISIWNTPVVSLGADTTICDGAQLVLDAGAGFSNYLWSDGSSNQTYTVTAAGIITIVVTDNNGCNGTDDIEVFYYGPVPVPSITQLGNTLQSSSAASYQWYSVPGGLISGATSQTYDPGQNGTYYVVVTDSNGCQSAQSPDFIFVYDGIADVNGSILMMAPNPASSFLTIELTGVQSKSMRIEVVDMVGKVVSQNEASGNEKYNLDVTALSEGVYFVKVSGAGFSAMKKLIISR